jgi:HK97 family phage portal protein
VNPLRIFTPNYWRQINGVRRQFSENNVNHKNYSQNLLSFDDENYIFNIELPLENSYLLNSWVNIAVNILIRNIARADFTIKQEGNDVTSGKVFDLLRRPNPALSRYDLWKETAAWWFLEGEALWWFGPDYSGGLPTEIYVLDPRKLHTEFTLGGVDDGVMSNSRRWFYQCGAERIPILPDELIHFKDWNPWNQLRGVNPLVSLSLELEQDYFANKANSQLLKNNAIPQGILKTDQTLRPEEADQLERRWESKYGAVKSGRKIAVLGKGTEFKPVTFSPDVIKLFELKRWNLYTILAKYGIPPRVANISDKTTTLSGKDTAEQHSAFWKYTLIPILRQFEQILETQCFIRLWLQERVVFDLWDIPELQESEDAQSRRDIAEINAGLKTINDVLKERGKEPKPWGDVWHKPKNLVTCGYTPKGREG